MITSPPKSVSNLVVLCLLGLFPHLAQSMPGSWFQDDLVRNASVIAIIEIRNQQMVPWEIKVIGERGDVPTILTVYDSLVSKVIKGRIPENPCIAQLDGAGDLNRFEKGRYIAFLEKSGFFYLPLVTSFKITGDQVHWYIKPYRQGDYGPYMGLVPLSKALSDINAIMNEKRNRPNEVRKYEENVDKPKM